MITYAGDNWLDNEREIAQQAIAAASLRLAEISGLAPDEAFYCIFGDITLDAQPVVSGAYYGYVSALEPRRIQLEIGQITAKLVLHELGHVLILTDPSDTNPAEWLSRNVIKTASGRPVTGPVRNMGYYSEERTGYISIMYPDHQHPVYFDDGKTTTEDICDMFTSWITGNIADNEAGDALDKFVSEYIARRLAPCRKVE